MHEDLIRERLASKGHALFQTDDGGWWILKGASSRHFGSDNWIGVLELALRIGAVSESEIGDMVAMP